MNNISKKTTVMVQTAVLLAIIIVLTVFNIGNIPVGPIVATIYQVPVIIGAVLLGPSIGALLGGCWGLLCFILAITGNTTDVVALATIQQSALLYFVIAFVPRLFTGLLAGLLFKVLDGSFKRNKRIVSCAITGAVGSACNTVLYLGMLYLFIKSLLAELYGIEIGAVGAMVLGVALSNGGIEAVFSAVITAAVCRAVFQIKKRS